MSEAARCLMVMGTGSDVGKSLIVAGLGRVFTRRGLRVAPFKPQNMSNNAAVTADGGEIGRAQALQALACCMSPSVHMNPVLLKPQGDAGAQIILQGRVWGAARAREYQSLKRQLMPAVLDSFGRLGKACDLVLVEGAGSAAEINLRKNDIANMGFARAVSAPVILVGDIDRGGVIASIAGVAAVLDPEDAALIRGFVVNRMRGDPSLFDEGMRYLANKTGWLSLGLVPHFEAVDDLPAEDSLGLRGRSASRNAALRIAVLAYPHISNFDDFDPLKAEPVVDLRVIRPGEVLPGDLDLVILPGSKATISDLAALRSNGWDVDLAGHLRRGGHVLGLCGGFQMLGASIADPSGIEGPSKTVRGLDQLDMATHMTGDKTVRSVEGQSLDGHQFAGYEIHLGVTTGPACKTPMLRFTDGRTDGAVHLDGRIMGCYVHGLFDRASFRRPFLERLGAASDGIDQSLRVEAALDGFADHLERHLDCDTILSLSQPMRQAR